MAKTSLDDDCDAPPAPVDPPCQHDYGETAVVFTGAVLARACRKCDRLEVLIDRTGAWIDIKAYLARRLADRSNAP